MSFDKIKKETTITVIVCGTGANLAMVVIQKRCGREVCKAIVQDEVVYKGKSYYHMSYVIVCWPCVVHQLVPGSTVGS